ncbi:MAG: metalloregulator ArsR/SmtB family transcription factor [Caldilineaceae bacterium]
MSFSLFNQIAPTTAQATVAIEPVYNVLVGMALLSAPNLNREEPWLAATAARLTTEQLRHNQLVFEALGATLIPTKEHSSFATYVDALAAQNPATLRDRIALDASAALEESLRAEAAQLSNDPPAMQQMIVNHLRTLWKTQFAAEWERKQSNMRFALTLNERAWSTESPSGLLRAFLRAEIPDSISDQLGGVQQIVFVPSPYVQLHATRFNHPSTLWLFMWADPWVWPMRNEPIQRSEIVWPASALADETRLRILELLAAHEEMLAQEIIALLDVSQSTVSRHLTQLRKAGFISEQRAGDANKLYRLEPARIGQFTYALSQLLTAENAQLVLSDARLEQPAALRPFLDRDGLVTDWPAKRKGHQAVLEYLIAKFALSERYSEAEVNTLLNQWHTYNDPAYLRRALVDFGLLKRTPDGAQYWREG